jgi:hypothetical protein
MRSEIVSVPTASFSSLLKTKNMPFSSFFVVVVVGRFASLTNCLFMHSVERRFCCHTNFEVVLLLLLLLLHTQH